MDSIEAADADISPENDSARQREQKRINNRLIENVSVDLEAVLGGATMRVGELASLSPGSVVPLDAALNAAVELRLNGITIARGELVAADDHFAVRLNEITQWPE
ncbi:FliM/FliN family flagellar motor switch protein [Sphingosinithalassobacter portus]|uniref:FliM/FliN family flagellar motor switch protein n=1 Tax=Stakelama portus TaxID=2676234 RepID=UPI000D6E4115|nr:FliM/FliN family flagellar motor switch protein [Sphingosinithalassobacter portus]